MSDLQAILRRCQMLVGIRAANLPGPEETAILLQFIYSHFSLFTIGEIQLAFEKAVAGELETEANCYENFSCEYFGKIMTAYKKWATQKFSSEQMFVEPVKEIDEDAKQSIVRGLIEEQYQKGDFRCTYVDFNQLMRDNYLSVDSLRKNAFRIILGLTDKYPTLINEIKAETAGLYLEWCKEQGKQNIYQNQ